MNPINVLWYNHERITTSSAYMLNAMLDSYPTKHYFRGDSPTGGAVIVFHGGSVVSVSDQMAAQLNAWAADRPWVIFVSVGDEYCEFPYGLLQQPNMRLWVQTPKPGKVKADRYLIEGYPHDCRPLLDAAGPLPRAFDWFFAGQVNHARRQKMAEVLRAYPYGPHAMVTTERFGDGLPHEEYYQMMKQALVVPCPSGLATPDSFRFAESLEAGCIPVLDACALDGVMGYWDMVLGKGHPFTVVEDWETFPSVVSTLLGRQTYKRIHQITQLWWRNYKHSFSEWLIHDIAKLGGLKR